MLDKIKAFLAKVNEIASKVLVGLKAVWSLIWNNSKAFLVVFGGLFAVLEFNKIKDWLIIRAGQNEINKDNKQDTVLVNDEKTDEQKSADLEKQSKDLPNSEKPVNPDWYEKK